MKGLKFTLFALICSVGLTGIFQSCSKDETDVYGSVYGYVTYGSEPIQAASTTLNPTGSKTTSGSDGRFEYNSLEAGQYTIQVVKSGYKTNVASVTVIPGQSTRIDIQIYPGSSDLTLSKTELNFSTTTDQLTFDVINSGQSDLGWQIQNNTDWVQTMNPSSGTTSSGQNSTVTVTINRALLESGVSYEGTLVVTSNAGDASLTVKAAGEESGNGGDGGGSGNVSSGLLAYYTFDNENCDDSSINGAHGSSANSPAYVADTPSGSGKSLFLNALQNQYVNIPYYFFDSHRSYTISLWIKDFSTGLIFTSISSDYIRSDYPRLAADSNGKFYFYVQYDNFGNTPEFSYEYSNIQDGNWHMVTLTVEDKGGYPGSCEKKLYIDGRLIDTASDSYSQSSQGTPTKMQIGGNNEGKSWNGVKYSATSMYVDNFRIYSRVLSASDVQSVYSADRQ
ncbi:MAG: carboxypeptidase regulatory-like domain-containing protein [Rikenellaceae bacterium]|nr:carboxypeptidase regulatory-like domain-containing protein [Rikenellaceae bacterium]